MYIWDWDLIKSVANSVGRVLCDMKFKGTGFMISDQLFLTNNHVICDTEQANSCLLEFTNGVKTTGHAKSNFAYSLAPDELFISSPRSELDFTIVKIGSCIYGHDKVSNFGCHDLVNFRKIPRLGGHVNIIYYVENCKQIIIGAPIVAYSDEVLHYYAGTPTGSSGGLILNENCETVGMHHYRRPTRGSAVFSGQPGPKKPNEGIRISAIANKLFSEKYLTQKQQALLIKCFKKRDS